MGQKIPMGTQYLTEEKLKIRLGVSDLTSDQLDTLFNANMSIDLHASTNTYYNDDGTIPYPLEQAAWFQYSAIETGEVLTTTEASSGSFSIGSWSESLDSNTMGGAGTENGTVLALGMMTKSILKTYGYLFTGNVMVY